MTKTHTLHASLVVAALLAWPLAQAQNMTKADHLAGKTRIGADLKADRAACATRSHNAKDVCLADARMGKEIGEARTQAAKDKGDADYQVAIEKCDALAGDAKGRCIDVAKARFGKT